MASDQERAEQRAAWRRAASKAAAAKRNGRFQRAAPPIRAGMLRSPSLTPPELPRCSFPGCPVRWVNGGADRPCADHAGADYGTELAARMSELIETTPAPPRMVTVSEGGSP